jgi:hypothetical protein
MKLLLCAIAAAVLFYGCKKTGSSNGCFEGLRLTPNDSIPFAGDTLIIYANQVNLLYNWTGPANFSSLGTTGSNSITIPAIQIRQSGWYYCAASVPGCQTYSDSVYIRVRYDQGTPPCSLTNNQITSTAGVPDFNAYAVTKNFDTDYGAIEVSSYEGIGYPEYNFVFNSNNGNTEPKDGIYYTTNVPAFDMFADADMVFMSCNYGGIFYFTSDIGQKIYVSHVNGKLRIAFCGLRCDDTSGANGKFSGELTEK